MADTRFSSSFIPKTPVVGASTQKEPMGLLAGVAGLIFLLSILSIGGAFAYKKIVENKIEDSKQQLAAMEAQVNKQEIARLVSFDKKLESTREVLMNHVSLFNFLKLVEKDTVGPLSFTSLKYNAPAGKNITVEMDGRAPTYRTLSEQQRSFLDDSSTVSADFKTMDFDKNKQVVTFTFTGEFNRNLAKYFNANLNAVVATSTASTTVSSTAATTTTASTTKAINQSR